MLLKMHNGKHVEIHIVGKRPKDKPYLRIGYVDGEYIAAEGNARAMRGLAHQILKALGDPVPRRRDL